MKISYKQIEPFLKNPDPATRVVLVYGPDSGLMKERAKMIAQSVVSDLNDPFNVAQLSGDILADDPARLPDEAYAVSMMGGDRLVMVSGATDKLTTTVQSYLENPSPHTLVVLEAGELGPRSSLRKLCEKSAHAAALPCYVEDERDVSKVIRQTLQDAGLRIDQDAVMVLASNIKGDRGRVRQALEKLLLYKGLSPTNQTVTLDDVMACTGEAGAITLDDLVYAVAGGQRQEALAAYQKLLSEGVNFIVIIRALQNHFRRLHLTRAHTESGQSVDQAVKALRPPLFFKQANAFKAHVGRWHTTKLNTALQRLAMLEAQCKTTGAPVETLCGQAILSLSGGHRR